MKIKYLLIVLTLFSLSACKQKNNANNQIGPPITASNGENITAANTLQNQIKAVGHYANEPLYYLYVDHQQCFFQVLINDIPVFRYFEDGNVIAPIVLNNYIRHSGKQTVTCKLYPQTQRIYGEGFKTLTPYTKFDIKLYERNHADTVSDFENHKLLLVRNTATKADKKTFIGAGEDYYEYTFTFDAKVPFELKSWENGQDLSKLDAKVLLNKTENAYQYYYDIIKNKQIETYYKLTFANAIAQIKSEYWGIDDIKASIKEDEAFLKDKTFKLEPLENYKLQLYGNGKVVCLEQTSKDVRLQKRQSIWGKGKNDNGGIEASFIRLYLYMPKGKDTFEIL